MWINQAICYLQWTHHRRTEVISSCHHIIFQNFCPTTIKYPHYLLHLIKIIRIHLIGPVHHHLLHHLLYLPHPHRLPFHHLAYLTAILYQCRKSAPPLIQPSLSTTNSNSNNNNKQPTQLHFKHQPIRTRLLLSIHSISCLIQKMFQILFNSINSKCCPVWWLLLNHSQLLLILMTIQQ